MDHPEQIPKVFISYSWDDEQHKSWVRKLATRLRGDGVDVTLDQWHVQPGDQLPAFMERAVRVNDFVLIICTPKYKAKSDERLGGVGYEGDVIQGEVFTHVNHRKFIPILRAGSWIDSAPSQLLGKAYISLRDGDSYELNYAELVRTLHGRRLPPPDVGGKPDFSNPQGWQTVAKPEAGDFPNKPEVRQTRGLSGLLLLAVCALVLLVVAVFVYINYLGAPGKRAADQADKRRDRDEKVDPKSMDLVDPRLVGSWNGTGPADGIYYGCCTERLTIDANGTASILGQYHAEGKCLSSIGEGNAVACSQASDGQLVTKSLAFANVLGNYAYNMLGGELPQQGFSQTNAEESTTLRWSRSPVGGWVASRSFAGVPWDFTLQLDRNAHFDISGKAAIRFSIRASNSVFHLVKESTNRRLDGTYEVKSRDWFETTVPSANYTKWTR